MNAFIYRCLESHRLRLIGMIAFFVGANSAAWGAIGAALEHFIRTL